MYRCSRRDWASLKLPSLVTVYVRHMSVMHQWYQKGKKKRRRKKITTGKAKETRTKKKEQNHRQHAARSFDASRLTQPLRCVSNWLPDTPLTSRDFSFFFFISVFKLLLSEYVLCLFFYYISSQQLINWKCFLWMFILISLLGKDGDQ